MELNIGYTTSLSPFMGKLIRLNGGNCGQFFTRSPQTFKTTPFNPNDWFAIKEDFFESQVNFVIHSSFLINFCKKQETINYVHKLIMEDMKICSYLNCIGTIIHMGKNVEKLPYEEAFQNYVKNIKYTLHITRHITNIDHSGNEIKPMLILETGAGQGTEIATDLSELGRLRKSLDPEEAKRVGFCIDTCHIFTAGYDLRNKDFVESLDAYIEMSLGWANVKVIHLNDSLSKLNQKVDRHADISYGEITKTHKDCEGFIKFIKMCADRNIPMVLETPGDCVEYSKQISLIKGWCYD
jgi:deoxyribonuclease-4